MNGPTLGERAADAVTGAFGSWRFLWAQTGFIAVWMAANALPGVPHWDAYPFGLLNLVFSTQAAYAAPLILLSQNRQGDRDRQRSEQDLETDTAAYKLLRRLARHQGLEP
ncbi:DUF1003 domain-containing protein [Kitasatospora viridis]|uniref:Uncharacterized protein DUF1003 n=1 Tax=Kitasatospora viridis TaxID=281105 RepID=A0A561UKQ4_9ACTN|nr:DUF1003 domain-containing protein [Kitasatospora viridis]TWF99925.1 uncharacterized protein DUF1003 [Kitasatospora viridis]